MRGLRRCCRDEASAGYLNEYTARRRLRLSGTEVPMWQKLLSMGGRLIGDPLSSINRPPTGSASCGCFLMTGLDRGMVSMMCMA